MNSDLDRLQSYPFQKLARLFEGIAPNPDLAPINLSIGEPRHPAPEFIKKALADNLNGLGNYPITGGSLELRAAIADWLKRRYHLREMSAENEILPVNGSREALFAFAQAVINNGVEHAVVVCPNPFYQIYEGAALLAGATPQFLNLLPQHGYSIHFEELDESVWRQAQLIYVCSPANPSGSVMTLKEWEQLFKLSDQYGFTIASDECYSELYLDENNPPLGGLEAAQKLGRKEFPRLVLFGSLSKRSSVPGLRSGFAAGDAQIIKKFHLYRTYHGCAMSPPVQAASIAAWNDEKHVVENRRLYREKFARVMPVMKKWMPGLEPPLGGFYLWAQTPLPDTEFAWLLYRDYNVALLPGSYLAREAHCINPGKNFVRIALVAPLAECTQAAERIAEFIAQL
ncbi:MAG: succinyldiaminopimelate transaminase [Burkholderiales bacterium]